MSGKIEERKDILKMNVFEKMFTGLAVVFIFFLFSVFAIGAILVVGWMLENYFVTTVMLLSLVGLYAIGDYVSKN